MFSPEGQRSDGGFAYNAEHGRGEPRSVDRSERDEQAFSDNAEANKHPGAGKILQSHVVIDKPTLPQGGTDKPTFKPYFAFMYMLEPAKEVATVPTMLHDMSRTRIASDKHLHLFLAGLPSCKPWQRWCVADSGASYMYQQDDKYVFNTEPTDSK
eukprot:3355026-Rhodomonas_salina.1